MRKLGTYIMIILIIVILIPTLIVKTFSFGSLEQKKKVEYKKSIKKEKNNKKHDKEIEVEEIEGDIKVYNTRNQKVENLDLEDYVKGVVAAEMPAEFNIEALKAQAVASRTYAISRSLSHPNGHPDHEQAPLCTGIHCQAYLTLDELINTHSKDWEEKYWSKIEEAVDSTKGEVLYYGQEVIEPLYHSTSGGVTEDSLDVFSVDKPYLKSVDSPYEEGAPKFKTLTTFTGDEFIQKLSAKYPSSDVTKENLSDKIKLVEKSPSGRIKKIAIDGTVINGSEIREIYDLNSTNFTISYNPKINIIEIETIGYGHGVGMSQWGANGMGKNGEEYEAILKHFYTGVEIKIYE